MSRISIGLDLAAPLDLPTSLDKAVGCGFDFVTAPLFRRGPRGKTILEDPEVRETCSDKVLGSERWSTCVVGKLSSWISLDDADTATRLDSESAFKQEVAWASHLTVPAVMTPMPNLRSSVDNFAAIVNQTVSSTQAVHFWVPIPTTCNSTSGDSSEEARADAASPVFPADKCSRGFNLQAATASASSDKAASDALQRSLMTVTSSSPTSSSASASANASGSGEGAAEDPWRAWNRIRGLCEQSSQLSLALVLTEQLVPPTATATATGAATNSDSDAEEEKDDEGEFSGRKRGKAITSDPANPSVARATLPYPELERWLGEPIKAVIVPTSLFKLPPLPADPSSDGVGGGAAPASLLQALPRLPLLHQRFLLRLHEHRAQIVLQGTPDARYWPAGADSGKEMSEAPAAAYRPYLISLMHLFNNGGDTGEQGSSSSALSPADKERLEFEKPYWDYLQAPLQPLADNLEATTYETFERDPPKYNAYQRAIYLALCDHKRTFERADSPPAAVVVMVVGAGRGPLVRRVLRASRDAGQPVRVYAVEKNPNAVMTLRHAQRTERLWGELIDGPVGSPARVPRVQIVSCDMRTWEAPEQADVLVSELLGSFGDNELSPECLDGAQRFLKRATGVSIPASYTSSIEPILSSKLWNEVKALKEDKWWETPFVARIFNYARVCPSAGPQDVFTFTHPNRASVIDNRRYASLAFKAEVDSVIHGLAGYFDCVLYARGTVQRLHGLIPPLDDEEVEGAHAALEATDDDADDEDDDGDDGPIRCPPLPRETVHCSIHPLNHTKGMQSWFPLFFPLKTPIAVTKGQDIDIRMWRCVTPGHKVWYEWSVATSLTVPTGAGGATIPLATSGIHNPTGRSYYIGL